MTITSSNVPGTGTRKERVDEAAKFPIGTKVEVIVGPLKGTVGEVVAHTKVGKHSRLILQVGEKQVKVGPRQIEKTAA